MSEMRYWIGLSLVPEVGPILSKRLLASLGGPERIFKAGVSDLLSVKGLNREKAENIKNFHHWDAVERQMKVIERKGIKVAGYGDPCYPEILREVEGAPVVLYLRGEYRADDRYGIAVVGSRKHTGYGESVAQRISAELAAAGFTIISGMARGLDTVAHKSALSAGGRTIAVLGSGLDISYPVENRGLMEKIGNSGCVLSEFPPGTLPHKENFPRRNRLISGLSMGVLVVEATSDSGSLITARYAVEQNKEVFSVPGNITSINSEGTNRLIQEGAKIVLEADDIIEELAPVLRGFINREGRRTSEIAISEDERRLCAVMTGEPKHIDLLSREAVLQPQKILELLLSLELKGVVKQAGGKRFYLS